MQFAGEVIIAIFTGIFFGIFTGITPGIHINLVSAIVLSLSSTLLSKINSILLCVFIISMSITHTFLDAIPGIFLGAPDINNVLTVLPGHKLLLEGRGKEAVMLTVIGSYFSLMLCIILLPFFSVITLTAYPIVRKITGYLLIGIILYIIFSGQKRLASIIIFLMSGILGIVVLQNLTIKEPLFAMLSGLFGISILITSLNNNNKIPEQNISSNIKIKTKDTIFSVISATIFGYVASFLPGFGSSQSGILASKFTKKATSEKFLVVVGGINTVNMALSLSTLYTIQKARNGAVLAIFQILGQKYDLKILLILIFASIISGSIAVFIADKLSDVFSKIIPKINYKILASSIIILITLMSYFMSGIIGLLILVTSISVGIFAENLGVAKSNCSGCIILPVILYML